MNDNTTSMGDTDKKAQHDRSVNLLNNPWLCIWKGGLVDLKIRLLNTSKLICSNYCAQSINMTTRL